MRAMLTGESVAVPRLVLHTVDDPRLSPDEVLVRAHASGVNRADLLQRRGRYSQPALARHTDYTIAGMEVAGEVIATGTGVRDIAVGQPVMAMCAGSYAELVAVDRRLALPVPTNLDWSEAAALPVATMTAYDALVRCASLAPGDTVLVTAAASAVGLIAIQVARLVGAGRVVATTRSADKADVLRATGADEVVTADGADLEKAFSDKGIDVVIDHVGAALFPAILPAMTRGARYVSVGRLGGQKTELDLNLLARDRLTLIGATFRTRSLDQYAEIVADVRERVLPAIAAGEVRACLADQYPLAAANEALDALGARTRPGKVTLQIGSGS